MTKTRVAVVGAGHIGKHHARLLASMPDVELVAIVDSHGAAATALAHQYQTKAVSDIADVVDRVDAAVIAVPTIAHFPIAREFLSRGVATLVEKPLAFSVEEAREMVTLAQRRRAVLQVGHVERFNPAWQLVEQRRPAPVFLAAQRFSKYPFRSLDVSVVFDVMIHDLELALSLIDSPVDWVEAVGGSLLSPTSDRADVIVRFANGACATFSASRVHHESVRLMRILVPEGVIEVDFLRRATTESVLEAGGEQLRLAGDGPRFPANAKFEDYVHTESAAHDREVEPLRLELNEFLACQREGRQPRVSGEAGYAAVALAAVITERLGAGSRRRLLRRTA